MLFVAVTGAGGIVEKNDIMRVRHINACIIECIFDSGGDFVTNFQDIRLLRFDREVYCEVDGRRGQVR